MLRNLLSIFGAQAQRALKVKEQQDFRGLYTYSPVSYADKYPDVPKPEPRLTLELLAAQWVSNDLRCEAMPRLAADLFESGLDTPSLRRLAGEMHVSSSADIEDLVGSMFRELGVQYPVSNTQALLIYSQQVAREVIHGERNAWAAASHLEKGTWPRPHENPEIQALSEVLDALDWDAVNRGEFSKLESELIETFARIGARTNRKKRTISFDVLQGKGWIADDFDAPLPDEILAQFEGRDKPDSF